VLKRTDDEFVPTTFASVAQWRYSPALMDGRPVPVYLTVVVEFNLR